MDKLIAERDAALRVIMLVVAVGAAFWEWTRHKPAWQWWRDRYLILLAIQTISIYLLGTFMGI